MVFWQYVESRGEVDPRAAGRALRTVHDVLAEYDGELPELHTEDLSGLLDTLGPEPGPVLEERFRWLRTTFGEG